MSARSDSKLQANRSLRTNGSCDEVQLRISTTIFISDNTLEFCGSNNIFEIFLQATIFASSGTILRKMDEDGKLPNLAYCGDIAEGLMLSKKNFLFNLKPESETKSKLLADIWTEVRKCNETER